MGEYLIIDLEIDLKGSVAQFSESANLEVLYEDLVNSSPVQKTLQFPLTLKGQSLTLATAVKLASPIKIISVKISSPEDIFSCILNDGRTFRPGQTVRIAVDRDIAAFRTLNSQNDKMALGLSGTSVAMEYASSGEGQIRPGSSAESAERYDYCYMDHLGSTRMVITDKDDKLTEAVLYAPYGKMVEELASSGEKDVREKFTGKEYDSDGSGNGGTGIGLFYFGARYYDPDIGIWTSTDPVEQFWNLYGYVGNPIRFTDPDGLAVGDKYVNSQGAQGEVSQELKMPDASIPALGVADVAPDIGQNGFGRFMTYFLDFGPDFFHNSINQVNVSRMWSISQNLRLSRQIATWGHQHFSNQDGLDHLRHQIGTFLLADRVGIREAERLTTGNELYGLIFIDIPNLRLGRALTGSGGTAFQWDDLKQNRTGLFNYSLFEQGVYSR